MWILRLSYKQGILCALHSVRSFNNSFCVPRSTSISLQMTSVTTLNTQVSHIFVSDNKLDTDKFHYLSIFLQLPI